MLLWSAAAAWDSYGVCSGSVVSGTATARLQPFGVSNSYWWSHRSLQSARGWPYATTTV